MKFYTRQKRPPQVIIVPLVDILAILLIFVIVTTTFRRDQPQVTIKLPESENAQPAEAAPESPAVLTIARDERLYLDATPVDLASLADALRTLRASGRALALNADEKAPLGLAVKVMDASKAAGFTDLPLWTEPAAQP
jgi:biopolymer transport protein ExbD